MNKYESLGFFDFEDFVEELNEEQLFSVNGGSCGSGGSNSNNSGNTSTNTKTTNTNTSYTPKYSGSCSGGGAVTPSYTTTQTPKCNGGSPSPTERYTKQGYWASKFGTQFAKSACAATSILNELAEQYLKETGRLLTDYQKDQAMKSAVESGSIDYQDAYVKDWGKAASKMAQSLGLKGSYIYTYTESKADAKIYALDKDKNGIAEHFVNDIGNGYYFDPYNGTTGLVSNLKLQAGRETRLLDYSI